MSLSICTCRQRSSSQKLESGLAEAHAGSGVARTVEAKGSEVHVNYAKANLEDLISPVKASLDEAETEASNTECGQSQFKLKSAPSRQDFVCSFRHESYTSEPSVRAAGAGRAPADEYCPRGNVRIASVSILAQTMQLTFVGTSPKRLHSKSMIGNMAKTMSSSTTARPPDLGPGQRLQSFGEEKAETEMKEAEQ